MMFGHFSRHSFNEKSPRLAFVDPSKMTRNLLVSLLALTVLWCGMKYLILDFSSCVGTLSIIPTDNCF